MKKVLTIGIAAYNASTTLNHTLKSLLIPEIMESLSIIVVNDGSTDDTELIAQKYVDKYPTIVKVINKENGGHGSVINKLIEIVDTPYFKLVDADDTVEKIGFIDLVNKLSITKADVVLSPFFMYDLKDNKKQLVGYLNSINKYERNKVVRFDKYYQIIQPTLHSLTYSTKLLKNSGFRVDEHCFYEDTEYSLYYFLNCKTILLLDEPVYCYWIGSTTQSVNIQNRLKRRSQALRVSYSLISFFENNKKNMDNAKEIFYKNQITGVLSFDYQLLFALLNGKRAKYESQEFDLNIKRTSPELYEYVDKGNMGGKKVGKVIKIFRKNNWNGYIFLHFCFRKSIVNKIKMG